MKEDLFVEITIHNYLGEKVETLVNKNLTSGLHKVNFNGSKFASGGYFYKIKAGNNVKTGKLLLLK